MPRSASSVAGDTGGRPVQIPDPARAILGTAGSAAGFNATERAAEFIRATLDRTAAYSWPPAARALAEGRVPRLTRRGWSCFYLWRQRHRVPVDLRAVEVEVVRAGDLFADGSNTKAATEATKATEGLTLTAFAAWIGIDRRKLSRHLVEIPPGPVPPLPPGKIPARRVGNTLRLFVADFRSMGPEGEHDAARGDHHPPPPPGPTRGTTAWDRSLDRLRHRRPPGG